MRTFLVLCFFSSFFLFSSASAEKSLFLEECNKGSLTLLLDLNSNTEVTLTSMYCTHAKDPSQFVYKLTKTTNGTPPVITEECRMTNNTHNKSKRITQPLDCQFMPKYTTWYIAN